MPFNCHEFCLKANSTTHHCNHAQPWETYNLTIYIMNNLQVHGLFTKQNQRTDYECYFTAIVQKKGKDIKRTKTRDLQNYWRVLLYILFLLRKEVAFRYCFRCAVAESLNSWMPRSWSECFVWFIWLWWPQFSVTTCEGCRRMKVRGFFKRWKK